MLFRCLLIVAALAGVALTFPSGPPAVACTTISPDPASHGAQPQGGNGGYVIATDLILNTVDGVYNYTAGQTYNGEQSLNNFARFLHMNAIHVYTLKIAH